MPSYPHGSGSFPSTFTFLTTVHLIMKVSLFVLLAASAAPAFASAIRGESDGVISALLRAGGIQKRAELIARQGGSCDVGYAPCSDGLGCCPFGQYCGTWGGKLGCCPIGKTCVANDNPCEFVGDVVCRGETFCCPAGDTCYRDTTGAPKCAAGGGAPTKTIGGTTHTLNTAIPSATFTGIPTPTFATGTTTSTLSTSTNTPFNLGSGAFANGVTTFALVAAGAAVNFLLAAN